MTPNEYQQDALRTAVAHGVPRDRLLNWGLGIAGEAGEVADLVKKEVFHGHFMDEVKMIKELGDVLWYIAVLAWDVGYSLEEVMERNIDKLRERYPEGFSQERSRNRVDETMLNPIVKGNRA